MSEKYDRADDHDHGDLDGHATHPAGRQRSMTTVTLTNEQFQSMYLQPKLNFKDYGLAKSVGNPTALGVTGFLLSLFPLSMDLMNFQSAAPSSGVTLLGAFYGLSGITMYLACIMEWVIGNTFPSVVFGTFGGFWISYGVFVQPSMQIAASLDPTNGSATAGAATTAYNSGIGLYFLTWGIICAIFFIGTLKTNVPLAIILFALIPTFELLAAAYFNIGKGNVSMALRQIKAAGAFAFISSLAGFWLDIALVMTSVGYTVVPPVGDLGSLFRGKKNQKEDGAKNA